MNFLKKLFKKKEEIPPPSSGVDLSIDGIKREKEAPGIMKYYDRAVKMFYDNPDANKEYGFEDISLEKTYRHHRYYHSYSAGTNNYITDRVTFIVSFPDYLNIGDKYNKIRLTIEEEQDEDIQEARWELFMEEMRMAKLKYQAYGH